MYQRSKIHVRVKLGASLYTYGYLIALLQCANDPRGRSRDESVPATRDDDEHFVASLFSHVVEICYRAKSVLLTNQMCELIYFLQLYYLTFPRELIYYMAWIESLF